MLERYAALLMRWNSRFGLTSIREPREIVRRHFAEPLVALPFVGPGHRLLDFGAGAGAPGLPLHIGRLGVENHVGEGKGDRQRGDQGGGGDLILVESSQKKASFLESVIGSVGVPRVCVLARRIRKPSELLHVGQVDAFAMRAVQEPESRIAWLPELLRPSGVGLLFLGREAAGRAEYLAPALGLEIVSRRLLPKSRASYLLVLRRPESRQG